MSASKPSLRSGSNEFSKGWTILLAGMLGVACGASPIPYNIVQFTVGPLGEEFGWTRFQAYLPITIYGVIASFLAPVFGWFADKYGARKVALGSLFAFGLSLAAVALTPVGDSQTTFYIYCSFWVVIGLVGIGSTPVTFSRAINLWFYKHRGLALGILLLGTSFTAAIIPQLANWSINSFGWRNMFFIVALLPLAIGLPIGLLLFREPREDERPAEMSAGSGQLTGVSLNQALRDYRFWLIFASIAGIAAIAGGAFAHLIPMLGDRGLTGEAAAGALGTIAFGLFTGRILTGILLDRFWAGFVAFPMLCLPAISCYILLGNDITFGMAAIAAFLLGFALGSESDLIAFLAGRYFGMAHYGKIYGMLYVPFGFFAAISPAFIYAAIYDSTGSYDAILFPAMFILVFCGALLLLLGRYPESFPHAADDDTLKPTGPITPETS